MENVLMYKITPLVSDDMNKLKHTLNTASAEVIWQMYELVNKTKILLLNGM